MRPFIALQYLAPHRALSRIVYWATRATWQPWKNFLIRRIVASYAVDMREAAQADPLAYSSFNAFFTRALQPDARPLPADPRAIACPADGRISQFGPIRDGRIVQAKGMDFTVAELLGDARSAARYANGQFITIYLSPRDYHRVHMPLAGTLRETVHIPGRLFSVAPGPVEAIPRLFARNERLACHFEDGKTQFAVVMVGALLVSGIETVWSGVEVPPYASRIERHDWVGKEFRLARGAEMARFNMGSTVIVLLPASATLDGSLTLQDAVRMGQSIGHIA